MEAVKQPLEAVKQPRVDVIHHPHPERRTMKPHWITYHEQRGELRKSSLHVFTNSLATNIQRNIKLFSNYSTRYNFLIDIRPWNENANGTVYGLGAIHKRRWPIFPKL